MKKIYTIAVLVIVALTICSCSNNDDDLSSSDKASDSTYYRNLLARLDWGNGTTYVIGHLTPDMDAVCSAISYAHLMRALGYKCEARVAGKCNRETIFTADTLGFTLPPILTAADGDRLILVDHNEYSQAVAGTENAKILQVIDHHGLGSVTEASLTYSWFQPVGSTCTIVYQAYHEYGVDIPDSIARVLLGGIISDTNNLQKSTAMANDSIALHNLATQLRYSNADVNQLASRMKWAQNDLTGMSNAEIYDNDAKNYIIGGYNIRVANVTWIASREKDLTHRLLTAMPDIANEYGNDMTFAIVDYYPTPTAEKEGSYILYYGDKAKDVAEAAFGQSIEEGIIYSDISISRKSDFIPMITDVINKMKAE